jgi:hypothetical protein
MALAPVVLESEEYANFFLERSKEGKFVLLDNGAHEASSLSVIDLHEAAHKVGASEIILPDVLGDTAATLEATYRGFKHFRSAEMAGGVHHHNLMVVPQGANLEEWFICLDMVMRLCPHSIGIPKLLTRRSGAEARLKAIHYVSDRYDVEAHLLGVWYDIKELELFRGNGYIRGVDSTLPYLYAREGRVLGDGEKPAKIMDPYDTKVSEVLLEANLYAWRAHVNV